MISTIQSSFQQLEASEAPSDSHDNPCNYTDMRCSSVIVSLACTALWSAVDAQLSATLNGAFGVTGTVTFTASGKNATRIKASIEGLGTAQAPGPEFPWHIHASAVSGTNCASAGGHLNLLNVDELQTCDPNNAAATCATGNLAGQCEAIGESGSKSCISHLFTLEDILDKAVVIHLNDANKTRISCGTIRGDPGTGRGTNNTNATEATNKTANGVATNNKNATVATNKPANGGASKTPVNGGAAPKAPVNNVPATAQAGAKNGNVNKAQASPKKNTPVKASPAAAAAKPKPSAK
ncbi:hypothetical protein SeLEV6574_g04257 [Synchytrium endobioticum]|uniref:Superoxide dismutase copper/zinc binding domain-containing protein n=1 Tax=Synchytrium endobioticum TaxID=286115 RepID=A0A507D088_9FUNG|nr:hypothetical protein SeLEV6574_g04257 [Synchytrium endobioticum]